MLKPIIQQQFIFPDEEEAAKYWAGHEFKKYVVTITAGPTKRPTFQDVIFVQTRTSERAIECAKGRLTRRIRGARFSVRLATYRDLGCVRKPA